MKIFNSLLFFSFFVFPVASSAMLLVINSSGYVVNSSATDSKAVREFENAKGNRTVWFLGEWDKEYDEEFEIVPPEFVPPESDEEGNLVPQPQPGPTTNVIRKLLAPSQIRTQELEDAWRQSSKPLAQKQYENSFFELTEQLLTALQDERAGQTPPVKLSFPEIDAILEQLFTADLATATRASIRLLGIDAALKRYDTLWWDDAIQHELPEN